MTLPAGTVTLLFTDIEGSTRLLEALGDRYGALLEEHHRLLRAVWADHGGVEVDTEGDAFFVAFARAGDAVAAAAEAQRALGRHAWPGGAAVRVRMGIHTGSPEIGPTGYWGRDVHYAARLSAAAAGGQVLVSHTTAPLVRVELAPLGSHALRDFPDPHPLHQLVIDGAGPERFPPPRTPAAERPRLPPAGEPLLGREGELADLEDRLRDGSRLVTVTGAGGSGKTALAIAVAHRLAGAFPGGVAFVALEELSDPAEVPAALLRALRLPDIAGVAPLQRAVDHLAGRRALLVLDNYEHLLDAAPVAARLADGGARVIVTSQVPLRVRGEEVVALGPLDGEAAARLLAQRTEAAGRAVDAADARVRDLCARLGNLPLALELAAVRLTVLAPEELANRLETSLEALGRGARDLPSRQRGLRAVLDWTCSLLDPAARTALARLSVFAGGFTVALAEDAFGPMLDELEQLLEAALLRRDAGGRLSMAPPVRRYAGELLADGGGEAAARRAIAEALLRVAEPFEDRWLLHVAEGARALNTEAPNLLEALTWARRADPVLHARLAAALGWWMSYAPLGRLGREHAEAALAVTDEPRLRARLLEARGKLALDETDASWSEQAADAWRMLGDAGREVTALQYATILHEHARDIEAALRTAERAEEVAAGTGDPELLLLADLAMGIATADVRERRAENLDRFRRMLEAADPHSHVAFSAATGLADVELELGDDAAALRHYGMAMAVVEREGLDLGRVIQCDTIALALVRLGRLEDAATAVGVAELGHEELSMPPTPVLQRALDAARAALTDARLAAGRRHARDMGLDAGLRWVAELARR